MLSETHFENKFEFANGIGELVSNFQEIINENYSIYKGQTDPVTARRRFDAVKTFQQRGSRVVRT